MNRLQSSAYRPTRTGCLHTSLVGNYLGLGVSGELIEQTVGISSNLSGLRPAEASSVLRG
jgi:hypothetical protein